MDQWRKFNVPGNVNYTTDLPVDTILNSAQDERLRGYWLDRDEDGQLVIEFDQTGNDLAVADVDPDGTNVIVYDELSQSFFFDGYNTIIIEGDS